MSKIRSPHSDDRNRLLGAETTEPVEEDESLLVVDQQTAAASDYSSQESGNEDESEDDAPIFERPRAIPSSIYESLDYDVCENKLWVTDQKPKLSKISVKKDFVRWVICLMIGILTALVAASIDITIEEISAVKFNFLKDLVSKYKGTNLSIPYFFWVFTNVCFVSIGALMVTYIEPVAAGSGIPQVKCYLNGIKVRSIQG